MTAPSLNIELANATDSSSVYAYVTGQAINSDFQLFLLQADGKTPYFPTSPTSTGTQLANNCAIPLGSPGEVTTITIPQLAGARLWFSVNGTLTFLLNPGPGLVEPSVSNPSDPNIGLTWDFCEFTYNSVQLFANITYVDFVSIPISLTLIDTMGTLQYVSGMDQTGLDTVAAGLVAQSESDGQGWDTLIVKNPAGQNLRVLSPNNGLVLNNSLFADYWSSYVTEVYEKYASTPLSVDTQASFGTVSGRVTDDVLTFPGDPSITFAPPTAGDIFSCSTGPFADTTGERGAIVPRIAAAFNRSTLLMSTNTPDVEISHYYQNPVTNHYSRIVHAANLDGRGYAFPYDDVTPTGGVDQAGTVASGIVAVFRVAVGGLGATATASAAGIAKSSEATPAESDSTDHVESAQEALGKAPTPTSPRSGSTSKRSSLSGAFRHGFRAIAEELSRMKRAA